MQRKGPLDREIQVLSLRIIGLAPKKDSRRFVPILLACYAI
jgi:hypothetical protein